MRLPLYQLDAFTDRVFGGNPAAVCPLEDWLDDRLLQQIAAENNLSETAYFVGAAGRYRLRWMTPTVEVELCGHATLASAAVICERLEPGRTSVEFDTLAGLLRVERVGGKYQLDFPSRPPAPCQPPPGLVEAFGRAPREVLKARDFLLIYDRAEDVRALQPNLKALGAIDMYAAIATAPGDDCDFVSRFFAPSKGVDEDPVTGSAHCELTPLWAERLGKQDLFARQVSARGGELWCRAAGERVFIAGQVAWYLEGAIEV